VVQSPPSELPGSRRRPDASGRHGRLVEPRTVRLPAIRPDIGPGTARLRAGFRRTPFQARMGAMTVMVPLELVELQLQVGGRPEEQPVQAFAPNRADQAFDEGMRERHVRHRLDSRPRQGSASSPAIGVEIVRNPEEFRIRHAQAPNEIEMLEEILLLSVTDDLDELVV
jgi:hypothetical protein